MKERGGGETKLFKKKKPPPGPPVFLPTAALYRCRNKRHDCFSILQFFYSIVACVFIIICVVVIQFLRRFIYFICTQYVTLYCTVNFQNNQVMVQNCVTNIMKYHNLISHENNNQMTITQVRKNLFPL